jgi:enolase
MNEAKIIDITAREILDSSGFPSVETTVKLDDGTKAVGSVPPAVKQSKYGAVVIRDHDPKRFQGMGALTAVENVNMIIAPKLSGMHIEAQEKIDELLIELDGSRDKSNLGVNALLSVSQSCLQAAAASSKKPLYRYLLSIFGVADNFKLPRPVFSLVQGGEQVSEKVNFREFFILLGRGSSIKKMLEVGKSIFLELERVLRKKKKFLGWGDKGGYIINAKNNLEVFSLINTAIKQSGWDKKTVGVGLDAEAGRFCQDAKYHISDFSYPLTAEDLLKFYLQITDKFGLSYLEDGFCENNLGDWQKANKSFAKHETLIVGNDLLATRADKFEEAREKNSCNAILVDPNQVGTITETIRVIEKAKNAGWSIVIPASSSETNDAFIADFAVGIFADLVKFGAPNRGERVGKYNRLVEIERELGKL